MARYRQVIALWMQVFYKIPTSIAWSSITALTVWPQMKAGCKHPLLQLFHAYSDVVSWSWRKFETDLYKEKKTPHAVKTWDPRRTEAGLTYALKCLHYLCGHHRAAVRQARSVGFSGDFMVYKYNRKTLLGLNKAHFLTCKCSISLNWGHMGSNWKKKNTTEFRPEVIKLELNSWPHQP